MVSVWKKSKVGVSGTAGRTGRADDNFLSIRMLVVKIGISCDTTSNNITPVACSLKYCVGLCAKTNKNYLPIAYIGMCDVRAWLQLCEEKQGQLHKH